MLGWLFDRLFESGVVLLVKHYVLDVLAAVILVVKLIAWLVEALWSLRP
jgi:hypothetical protein